MKNDLNDTLRNQGPEAVRARHDRARKHERNANGNAGKSENSSSRFRLVPFRELRTTQSPEYLIKCLLPRVGIAVVWGPPKSGKSFLTTDMMTHIALDWAYRDRKVIAGAVVYCAFEGASGYGKRAEAFRRHHNIDEQADVPFFLVPGRMDFVKDHRALIAAVQDAHVKPVAVVLDTLNRSLRGSESKDEDMAAYVAAADAVREKFKCLVVIVHHCGVDGTRPRGHTSLTGAVDAQLAVRRDEADNIVTTVEWMKDGPDGAELVSRLHVVNVGTDDGDEITSCVVVPAACADRKPKLKLPPIPRAARDQLLECLAEMGAAAPPSDVIPTAVKTVTLGQWRERLLKVGIINAEGSPREQFKRIHVALQNARAIGVWEDLVWAVT